MGLASSTLSTIFNEFEWNTKFATWHRPPSDAEEARIQRAARMVGDVIRADADLKAQGIAVVPQGSYHNNTNKRLDSDMDLCARYEQRVVWYSPEMNLTPLNLSTLGITPMPMATLVGNAIWLKNKLQNVLEDEFGARNVARGNKALTVRGIDGSRVDADLVPAVAYWLVRPGVLGEPYVVKGAAIYADGGRWIYNFPDQHYARGVEKNQRTGRRYKRTVRILKHLSDNIGLSKPPKSFFVESLTYNCPDWVFTYHDGWYETITLALTWMHREVSNPTSSTALLEANGIKPLFGAGQPWTVADAQAFTSAASRTILAPS